MEQVRKWFLENRREFPWRQGIDPYRVLISEVMLQQTRASVVVGYFTRWMERFPTIQELSQASEDEVIKMWEGLGYYSRARNLLSLAKVVVSDYGGKIPDTLEDLLKLKGLGPYTAGAILAFGFHKKAAALDGNVMRVLARFLAFKKEVKKHATFLRESLYDLLSDHDPHIIMEGLIELGALICTKTPKCHLCPLQKNCKALQKGLTDVLPLTPSRKSITTLFRSVACISSQGGYLVRQVEQGKVMAGLFEFPYIEHEEDLPCSSFQKTLEETLSIPLKLIAPLKKTKHHFTRFKAHLAPFHFVTPEKKQVPGYAWIDVADLYKLPFSSGHRKILESNAL